MIAKLYPVWYQLVCVCFLYLCKPVWSVGVYAHSQLAAFYTYIPNCYLIIKYTVLVHPKGINIALYTLRGLISHT